MRACWIAVVLCLSGCSKCSQANTETAKATQAQVAKEEGSGGGGGGGGGRHEDRNDPAIATPALQLAVAVNGAAPATWQKAQFDTIPHFASKNSEGENRDCWSLRELAHKLVGPNARVTAVIGDTTEDISAEDWTDPSKTPIVHTTHRGAFKFRWADQNGEWDDSVVVRDVVRLEIAQ